MDRYRRELSVALALGLLLLTLAFFAPGFYTPANFRDLLVGAAPILVAACGMTIVILARQIDISIGSQFAVAGVVAGLLSREGLPIPVAAAGAIAAAGLMGAVNGVLVAGLGLPAIVVTLATMVTWREALRWATEGVWVQDLPASFQWFGLGQGIGRGVVTGVALAIWAAIAWGLAHSGAGRTVYATGSDPEVARLAGIQPRRVVFGAFVSMGLLTGVAAVLAAIQFGDVQVSAGTGLELRVIAAVVVGGVAISGGRGTAAGTLLGVALLAASGPALTFLGTEAHWDRALQGLIILAAVSADVLTGRARRRTRAEA